MITWTVKAKSSQLYLFSFGQKVPQSPPRAKFVLLGEVVTHLPASVPGGQGASPRGVHVPFRHRHQWSSLVPRPSRAASSSTVTPRRCTIGPCRHHHTCMGVARVSIEVSMHSTFRSLDSHDLDWILTLSRRLLPFTRQPPLLTISQGPWYSI